MARRGIGGDSCGSVFCNNVNPALEESWAHNCRVIACARGI